MDVTEIMKPAVRQAFSFQEPREHDRERIGVVRLSIFPTAYEIVALAVMGLLLCRSVLFQLLNQYGRDCDLSVPGFSFGTAYSLFPVDAYEITADLDALVFEVNILPLQS